ncbi:MAG: hypothetical protein AB7D00_09575 [Rhodospirillaceae bacterium]
MERWIRIRLREMAADSPGFLHRAEEAAVEAPAPADSPEPAPPREPDAADGGKPH